MKILTFFTLLFSLVSCSEGERRQSTSFPYQQISASALTSDDGVHENGFEYCNLNQSLIPNSIGLPSLKICKSTQTANRFKFRFVGNTQEALCIVPSFQNPYNNNYYIDYSHCIRVEPFSQEFTSSEITPQEKKPSYLNQTITAISIMKESTYLAYSACTEAVPNFIMQTCSQYQDLLDCRQADPNLINDCQNCMRSAGNPALNPAIQNCSNISAINAMIFRVNLNNV